MFFRLLLSIIFVMISSNTMAKSCYYKDDFGIKHKKGGCIEKDVKKAATKAKKTIDSTLTKAREDTDSTLTIAKKDIDNTLTTAKNDTDNELTNAKQDIVTEWNYFFATACGEKKEYKALRRKFDQGKISATKYSEELKTLNEIHGDNNQGCSGLGVSVSTNGKPVLLDKNGNPSELPPEKQPEEPFVITEEMEVDMNIGPFEIPSQGDVNSSLAKPPFNATPLGQNLSYPNRVTDNADATSTSGGNNPTGGYPGLTRDGGKKFHGGFDDPSQEPFRNDLARYTGTQEGTVVYAGPAFTNKGQYLGYQVKIRMEDGIDIYESSTIHHKEALVLTGAKVQPNDPIGIGSGEGNQFNSSESGGPHLHWRLKKNGKLINPLDGSELKK